MQQRRTGTSSAADRRVFLALIPFLVALLCYAPSLSFDFAYDDNVRIVNDALVNNQNTFSISEIKTFFSTPVYPGDLYRPIMQVTFRLNYLIGGLNPSGYHLLNVLLHALNGALLFLVVLGLVGSYPVALVSALLFVLHPVQVESVGSIVGRAELLVAAFGLSALLLFEKALSKEGPSQHWLKITSFVTFFLAVFSKESALIPLYAYFRGHQMKRVIPPTLVLLGVSCLYLAFRSLILDENFVVAAQDEFYHPENALLTAPFLVRLISGIHLFGVYLSLLALPVNLSIDYSYAFPDFLKKVYSVQGMLYATLALGFGLLVWTERKQKYFFFGLWFFIAFSLTINILVPIGTLMAERLAYLPSVGLITFCVAYFDSVKKRRGISRSLTTFAVVTFVAAFGMWMQLRLPVWRDSGTVFEQGVKDAPQSSKMSTNLAIFYYQQNKLDLAQSYFERSNSIDPTVVFVNQRLMAIALRKKDFKAGEYWARKVLELRPEDALASRALETMSAVSQQTRPD